MSNLFIDRNGFMVNLDEISHAGERDGEIVLYMRSGLAVEFSKKRFNNLVEDLHAAGILVRYNPKVAEEE